MFKISLPKFVLRAVLLLAVAACAPQAFAQSLGSAGTVTGVVTDPNGAVIPGASVKIENSVTGFNRAVKTDADGAFRIGDVPPNTYQLSVAAEGFTPSQQRLDVRSSVPIQLKVALAVAGAETEVTVTDTLNTIENVPTSHTDIDQSSISKLPIRSPGSGLSEAVTLAAPGVVADSNGMAHPLGEHSDTSYSIDNQNISDQQSKAFSTQLPPEAVQSLEVITGATPAEYGDKTSLVVNVITKSGLGQKKPTGSFTTTYGTFGDASQNLSLAYGGQRLGNFLTFNFERSGRFLDAPEFNVLHDRGTSANVFDRVDYSPTSKDTLHLNLFLARNSFEIPNTFDQQALGQDQRQLVRSVNIAPGYVHVFSPHTILTVNPFYRLDQVWYFPSANPFNDQTTTISQQRRLANTGLHADVAYVKGKHNAKFGAQLSHTFLTEAFQFGITDPNFNDPASPGFLPGLLPFDLTRGGHLFAFRGHTDIKQEALFAQDAVTLGSLTLNLGLRFDNYVGLSRGHSLQPRLGLSYLIKRTGTVLRASYTRNFETPYNENLVLSSTTGAGGLADGTLGAATNQALKPGLRRQFNVGFQQSLGKHVVLDVDYFNKRTANAYDFNALLNTPITFPISWDKAKVDGIAARVNLTNYHGLTASFVAGHTRARFFPPESGGLFFNSDLPTGVFRIDHDQKFQQTTQVQYQFQQWKRLAPYVNLTWRYDSGMVAGAVTDYATALGFTADEQQQIGLFCGATLATLSNPITSCASSNRGALRVRIPQDGTENDDTNPPRIAPRNLFDVSAGTDNLLRTERTKMTLRFTVINLTNKEALYNFLSTFSGTHFVSPRAFQGQVGVTF
ncbi:MAG: TonB-dependent receptor [Acidobacteriota bacterium]|nr:TonB-dependent receptor [Acidobacteriota bacterium]